MRKDLLKIGIGLLSAAFILFILIAAIVIIGKVTLLYGLALIVWAWVGFSILLAISIPVIIYGIIAEPRPPTKAPEIKARKQKITRAKPTSRFMTDLKFGAFLIVAGFLIRLLMVNVLPKKYGGEAGGDWVLILFVAIGILIIGFGIVEYAIARKKSSW